MKGSIPQLLGELMAIHTLSENENIQILQECKAEYESLQKELEALAKKLEELKVENKRNYDKWLDLEQNYVLPLFSFAREVLKFDLEKAVMDNAGKNCIELFMEKVKEVENARKNNDRLKEFTTHATACPRSLNKFNEECTCGLEDLLEDCTYE